MRLGQLYHWSPADRFSSIQREGLRPFSPQVTCSAPYEFVCTSPDPRTAWGLSGAVAGEHATQTGRGAWDLWQIEPADTDEMHIRAEFGPRVHEVQIRNAIPPQRLFHVGRRGTT